jgi:glycosyltransferase involved in cell wall biosynthesis
MINVLHIVFSLKIGGLEKFVLDLSSNYSTDINPCIVCLDEAGDLGVTGPHIDIYYLSNDSTSLTWKIFKFLLLIRKLDFDIIHTHNLAAHHYGAIASYIYRKPLIHTKHGKYYPTKMTMKFLERFSFYFTKILVGVSEDIKESYIRTTACSREKVTTILNGINVDNFVTNKNMNDSNPFVNIGIVARLSAEKDHRTLLHAFKIALDLMPNIILTIVGDGPEEENLLNYVQDHGLKNSVIFLGKRLDVPQILSTLDIFVLSSVTEGVPISLLEAMAACLPCIATNVGGNPEVVEDGVTGYLVPAENPQMIAEKLLILANDRSLRISMGLSGNERVKKLFSISTAASKYEKLYKSVLNTDFKRT